MKKLFIAIIALLMFTAISAKEKNNDKEKEAIKKVIAESTKAYRARDLNILATTFIQDKTTTKLRVSNAGFNVINGWDDINVSYKQAFANNPDAVTGQPEKINYKIKVYGESAWAIHDEIQSGADAQVNKQIITHFLEKHDGKWKIVYMSQIFASSYDVAK